MTTILHKHSSKSSFNPYYFLCFMPICAYCYAFIAKMDIAYEFSRNIAQKNIRTIPEYFRRRIKNTIGVST